MNKIKPVKWIAIALVGVVIGYVLPKNSSHAPVGAANAAATIWTCSMHPQIKLPKAGKCPLCGMDLIPLKSSSNETLGKAQLQLSPYAQQLAGIEVTPVRRENLTRQVRMVGKIEPDETRQKTITAWVPGRLDRLYVDYTGVKVEKGDHLVYLYSPDLIAAQEELIQSALTVRSYNDATVPMVRERAIALVETSREKLRLLGLTPEQIANVESRGKPDTHLNIYSPISGIVLEKHAKEGMYVQTGSPIYQIADLSTVWLKLDAYESDLRWLHYGQGVQFETEAHPGEPFEGRIAFIDPVLDPKTRTVKIRVNVPNTDGRLKPGMFVRAIVEASTSSDGRVFAPELAGKFISPMHPEILKDAPGKCDVCGMDLVPIEEYGFATSVATNAAPLVIPVSAPLITGKRAVVYLQVDETKGIYEGREITLGARAGESYIVLDGLAEGDIVVKKGAFKIDSAIQIHAGPSMMNPVEEEKGSKDVKDLSSGVAEAFKGQLNAVLEAYLGVQQSLGADQLHPAHGAAGKFKQALQAMDMSLLEGEAHLAWMKALGGLEKGLAGFETAQDIAAARIAFSPLSEHMIDAVKQFKPPHEPPIFEIHCPMAFDFKGASWMQATTNVFNPYFGAEMLECGVLKHQLSGSDHIHP